MKIKNNKEYFYNRFSIRLPDYNYSQSGYYFVTICTKNRYNFFGEIINNKMYQSDIGKIVEKEWWETFYLRDNIYIDEFVIMPNHFHAIIEIIWNVNDVGIDCNQYLPNYKNNCNQYLHRSNKFGPQKNNLFTIIGNFKAAVTRKTNSMLNRNETIWQTRFYDRIIRNQEELIQIRQYIKNNPKNWSKDLNNLIYLPQLKVLKREKMIKEAYLKIFSK